MIQLTELLEGVGGKGKHVYLTQSVYTNVLQKPTPPHIRQLILYYEQDEEQVDEFVENGLSQNDLKNTLCDIKVYQINPNPGKQCRG